MNLRRCLALLPVLALLGCGSNVEHRNVAFAISPDGKKVVFSSADGDLYLFDLTTKAVERLTQTSVVESAPTFSPDGATIAYACAVPEGTGTALFTLSLADKVPHQLTNDPTVSDSQPSFSPNGKQLTFARAHWYRQYSMGGMVWRDLDVYVMNTDGTKVTRLTNQKYYGVGSPRFLANGKQIVYAGDKDMVSNLFTVSVRQPREPKPLLPLPKRTDIGSAASEPVVSPDGKQIAFISDRNDPFAYDLLTTDPTGAAPTPLKITSVARYNQAPAYLPDGKGLLYLAGTDSNAGSRPIFSLYKVGSDGSAPQQIADSDLFTDPSNWKPK